VSAFQWQARVYWEDTDGGGVVYYANYLKYLERARTEWLRKRGMGQRQVQSELGVVFAVVHLTAEFRRAARLDDLLCVSCDATLDGGASIAFRQQIWRDSPQGELLFEAQVRVACVDALSFRPRRIPAVLRKDLN
jgi:acyl-CoA thioester hydrolase